VAMNAGDAACTVGLSSRFYSYWMADARAGFDLLNMTETQRDMVRATCYAMARAVVDEIAANGVAYIPVTQGALQREIKDDGTTVDTQAPSAEREIRLR
jgi:hypothetical protein